MAGDPGRRVWAIFYSAILLGLSLAVAAQSASPPPVESHKHVDKSQYAASLVVEMGLESGSGQTVQAANTAGAASGTQGDTANAKRKGLTAFFVIGFIVNILLIGVFLFWAAGQWRKTK